MNSIKVKASAHPTMGIVLLGGLSDPALRLPYHNSAGICYSLADRESVAETTLTITDKKWKIHSMVRLWMQKILDLPLN